MKNFPLLIATPIVLLAAGIILAGAAKKPFAAPQASNATATTPSEIKSYNPHKLEIPGVENAGEVTPELWRGAQPTGEGFSSLAKMGVGIVVDLREGNQQHEREEVTRRGMKFVSIPWYCMRPNDEVVAEFLELLEKNPHEKVFVHCREGIDRTGMMIAAYRMTAGGRTAAQALQEMQDFGFSFTHRVLCLGLAGYEENFPEAFATHPAFQKLRAPAPPVPSVNPGQR